MPTLVPLSDDPKPAPGRPPRRCRGCGAKHPLRGGAHAGLCGACVFEVKAYRERAAAVLAARPDQLYRAERPVRVRGE